MAQRSIWRNPPDDPKTGPGWLLREGGSRVLSLPIALVYTIVLGALAVGWSPWAVLALPLVFLHLKTPLPPSVAASPLATVPPPGPAFECDIEIRRGGTVYGTDQGIITFVSGWLHFAGRRTEFALEEGLAHDYSSFNGRVTLLLDGEEIAFRPRGGWDTSGQYSETESDRVRKAFGVWFHSPSAREGTSILPPREVHASGLARAWRQLFDCIALDAALIALMIGLSGTSFVFFFALSHGLGPFERLRQLSRLAKSQKKALSNVSKPLIGPK